MGGAFRALNNANTGRDDRLDIHRLLETLAT